MADLRALLAECRPFVNHVACGFKDVPDGLDPTFYRTLSAEGARAEGEKLYNLLARIDAGLQHDSEWQPIGTVPGEGVKVDLWFERPPPLEDVGGFRLADCNEAVEGLWLGNDGARLDITKATHWRLAAPPPALEQGESDA